MNLLQSGAVQLPGRREGWVGGGGQGKPPERGRAQAEA